MSVIYLDNNATTRVDEAVLEEMLPYLSEYYGNPSSMHTFGGQLARNIEQARENVAALLGAQPTEIIFTSCGTEGDNAAIRAALITQPDKKHIVTTAVEHPAVYTLCKRLEKEGYRVTYLPVNGKGLIDLKELKASLTDDTALVSVMCANNETGTIFPIERIGQIVKERGILFHVDAVQAVGKVPLNMSESTVDFLVLSGHKLHAPKGIGVLYVRKGVRFRPLLIGGHQERGRRGGTSNVPAIIGLGKAAELAIQHVTEEVTQVKELRDRLEQGLLSQIPDCQLNGHPSMRLPNTTNIGFKYIEGEAILLSLDRFGICASSGSACTSGSLEPSHVLRAMGLPYTLLHGSIRFSLSRYTTSAEIDRVLEVMPAIVERLRTISPFKNEADEEQGWLQTAREQQGRGVMETVK
ncbi:aminotransferase, class V superfamily [Coleofasciculus chthonoplastes PCC 7420]|uniref:Cysteine desulfurase n=1 Tax=Coleofasciculus chthonoplastes PCC 7420 TaxID=118168 RepID=B4VJQ0_9CYAN|nr:cysteine desulfurase NifS [Coleofasciculus chthonoplastes]EDX77651.1 aminotransferase, class V superfamily [Coleofasciculus chthonoplastes PCC 7420]